MLGDAALEAATPVQPETISPSDPAARFTHSDDSAFFPYSTNRLVNQDGAYKSSP